MNSSTLNSQSSFSSHLTRIISSLCRRNSIQLQTGRPIVTFPLTCTGLQRTFYSCFNQWQREGVFRPGQTSVLPPRQSDRQLIFLWLQRWHWCGLSLSKLGCNYIMQIPAKSVLQCKRQFARSGQIAEFHIFAPPNAAPYSATVGTCPIRPPPSHHHWL